jgi:hypothetical protein
MLLVRWQSMMPHASKALALAFALAVAACGGDPDAPTVLSFQAYNLTSTVSVDGAWIVVAELRAPPAANCNLDEDNRLAQRILVDLVAPPQNLGVPAASYCRFELLWHGVESGETLPGAPPDMRASAIYVVGTRSDGVRFSIVSEIDQNIDVLPLGPDIEVGDPPLFIGVDVAALVDEVDLDGALLNGSEDDDGKLVVNSANHEDLLLRYEQNIDGALHVFPDQDADGELDADETDVDDAVAYSLPQSP